MYITIEELKSFHKEHDLIALTDEENTTLDTDAVEFAMQWVDDVIDTYLRRVYTLPLNNTPIALSAIAAHLTFYQLHVTNNVDIPEAVQKLYDQSIKELLEYSKGVRQLAIEEEGGGDIVPPAPTRILTNKSSAKKYFNDELFSRAFK